MACLMTTVIDKLEECLKALMMLAAHIITETKKSNKQKLKQEQNCLFDLENVL